MHSAIYEGSLGHRRIAERPHELSYRVAMPYLDLDEIGDLVGGRLTLARPGLARFRRQDYLGDPAVALIDSVRALIRDRLGTTPLGPVRLLTHLRSFGRCFNPVSFYYCFAADGEGLDAIVAEVTNTPWGERCAYVLPCGDNADGGPLIGGTFDKMLHVSPFMGMKQRYAWLASVPGETLSIHIDSIQDGERAFEANLMLHRRPLDRRTLALITARYPLPAHRMLVLIYAHGVILRLKGVHVRPHP